MQNCQICGLPSAFLMKKDGWPLYRCAHCGLIFVSPPPQETYLQEEVYSTKSGYQRKKESNRFKSRPSVRFAAMLDAMGDSGNGKKVLDVGCSSGEFMFFANRRGFQTWGVELNDHTAAVARADGLNVFVGTLAEAKYSDRFFDVIVLGDVLEHVPDLNALLAECARILKKNGTVIIATPNAACFWARATLLMYQVAKIPWAFAEPPHHLFYLSPKNLDLLMKKYGMRFVQSWPHDDSTLRGQLGATHLWRRYKDRKTLGNALFLLFAFSLYTFLYGINTVTRPFRKQWFCMTGVYQAV